MSEINGLSIRELTHADLPFAASCTAAEGWLNEDLSTLEGFFLYDPHGCLVAELDHQRLGMCFTTSYGRSGFIGELIVIPEARGQGIGARLLNHGVQLLHQGGVEAIYLDGVLKAVDLYERNGFSKISRSWRFAGRLPGRLDQRVRRMTAGDLDQVCALDHLSFGADRSFFLKRRYKLFPQLSFVMMNEDEVIGYILGRCHPGRLSAGPWVMREGAGDLPVLLQAVALEAGEQTISLGVLDLNREAIDLLHSMGFMESMDSPWRMVWGKDNYLGASTRCFAIGSAAKG